MGLDLCWVALLLRFSGYFVLGCFRVVIAVVTIAALLLIAGWVVLGVAGTLCLVGYFSGCSVRVMLLFAG